MIEELDRIPRALPVIHLSNTVIYPHLIMPLSVNDESLKKVIDFALANDKLIGIFLSREDEPVKDKPPFHRYGTAASILRMFRNNDGSISMMLQGVSRIKLEKVIQKEPFTIVEIESIKESKADNAKIGALKNISIELLEKLTTESTEHSSEIIKGFKNIKQPGRVADIIAGNILVEIIHKQLILETLDVAKRFEKLNKALAEQIKQMRLENSIRDNIQLEMDEDQRRYYLREQLIAIKKELGEDDDDDDDEDEEITLWRLKIALADLPEHVEDEANEELDRLEIMGTASPEYTYIHTYLEWLVALPWNKRSKDRLNIPRIEKILEKDHYGLQKVKERIVEFIAVKRLNNELKSPILCFVGPPGVGKTSFGKSIAKALNRKFARISLGGIRDEAEIRGHRRTYVGAMPGKILNEIKRCGTANPLFMLDEIDKICLDFRGDPSSALLEVLDPEQNSEFVDNYINLRFDLSDVIFITTANDLYSVPAALEDRMEVLEFSSYVEEEKIHIAKKYLIPKEIVNNGLTKRDVRIDESALQEIIRHYVREAGVRNLQRTIASIMRKIAKKKATMLSVETAKSKADKDAQTENGKNTKKTSKRATITSKNVKEYLGRRKFLMEIASKQPEVGVVTGLAWTSYGGEILFCEAIKIPGKGDLLLTGLLGEVMQESAKIAFSYIKGNSEKYGIDPEDFMNFDFHIHLPTGAIPKEGPSAGITLTTAIISLLTDKKIKPDVAMTGELTLKGKVLAIGGLKEKLLAAKRSGVKTVLLPEENRDCYEDLDKDTIKDLEIFFVSNYEEVLKYVVSEGEIERQRDRETERGRDRETER